MAPKRARTSRNVDEVGTSREHERISEMDKGKAPMVEEPEEERPGQVKIQAPKEMELYLV